MTKLLVHYIYHKNRAKLFKNPIFFGLFFSGDCERSESNGNLGLTETALPVLARYH